MLYIIPLQVQRRRSKSKPSMCGASGATAVSPTERSERSERSERGRVSSRSGLSLASLPSQSGSGSVRSRLAAVVGGAEGDDIFADLTACEA